MAERGVTWDGELANMRTQINEIWDELQKLVENTNVDVNATLNGGSMSSAQRARKGLSLVASRVKALKAVLLAVKKEVTERRRAARQRASTAAAE